MTAQPLTSHRDADAPAENRSSGGNVRPLSRKAAHAEARRVARLLEGKRFGVVTITINNGRVVLLEESAKYRPAEIEPLEDAEPTDGKPG